MMNIKDLEGKLVAVLGYGQEGQAVTRYLMKHGINPVLFDQRPWNEWPMDEQSKIAQLGLNFIFGPDAFKELAGFDVAFRSPGIPLTHPDLLLWPKLNITSQTIFFFDNCLAKIIGVTGTKGKGTTATLISEMLKMQYQISNIKYQSYLTGNIGKEQPLDIINNLTKDDWVVYELSSFQMQDLHKSPHISVVLMTTSEHLDYHKDNNEYIDAKSAITKFQTEKDFAVISADYPASIKIGEQGKGKKVYFSRRKPVKIGCFASNDEILIANSDFRLPTSSLQLKGRHNLENICAAVAVGTLLKIEPAIIQKSIENFKGLEHRLEFVGEKQGIKFYNDSFSTTPETAIAAIQSFAPTLQSGLRPREASVGDEQLIVILGGSTKQADFAELGKTIKDSKNIKALILIGQEAKSIKKAIGKSEIVMLEGAKDMNEIFSQIKSVATRGDVVLLSPACASFDMFKNYKDRGEQFKKIIQTF